MRILVVATSSQGGAGIAATRSFNALRNSGVDVAFLSLDGENTSGAERANWMQFQVSVLARKIITFIQRAIVQSTSQPFTGYSYGFLSQAYRNVYENYDIIHFHSTYNIANTKIFREYSKLGKSLVFTMHDERLSTGGCHYSGNCSKIQNDCRSCPIVKPFFHAIPVRSLKASRDFMSLNTRIEVTAPSFWLAQKAELSPALKGRSVQVINNPIPEKFFQLGVSEKESIGSTLKVGFISQDLWNPFKGFEILLTAIQSSDEATKRRIELKVATANQGVKLPNSLKVNFTHPRTEEELSNFYRGIDILVVPSLEDNSPSVIGESLASGTPVIGTNTGGIPELLNLFAQPIIEKANVSSLVAAINRVVTSGPPTVDTGFVMQQLGEKQYVEKTLSLYQRLTRK
jgi:glycosyltransferase involved in cell wall biosynthesis